ncbi:MAG: hypothetical protein K5839_00345 [Treponemataceae bacterium]|nr:hypothetical protein [Treponemataceae bacterium]
MKKFTSLILCLILASSLFAFDFGGVITATGYTESPVDTLSYKQYADINFWMKAKFSKNLTFTSDFMYSMDYDTAATSFITGAIHKADVTALKLVGNYELANRNRFGFSLGRFAVADITGLVLAQNLDAAGFTLKTKNSNIFNFYAGYTGLLNSKTITMYSRDFTGKSNQFYCLAAPYIAGGFVGKFPSLFADQNLAIEAIALVDAYDFSDYTAYADLALDGPIYKSLYYALATSFSFNYIKDTEIELAQMFANLSKVEISYFFDWYSLILTASAIYVSDDFNPITQQSASIDSVYYDNILKTGISASVKFIEPLFISLGADALFAVDETNLISGYTGLQYNVAIRYTPLDDLQIGASASQLFYADSTQPSYLTVKGSVRLSY